MKGDHMPFIRRRLAGRLTPDARTCKEPLGETKGELVRKHRRELGAEKQGGPGGSGGLKGLRENPAPRGDGQAAGGPALQTVGAAGQWGPARNAAGVQDQLQGCPNPSTRMALGGP